MATHQSFIVLLFLTSILTATISMASLSMNLHTSIKPQQQQPSYKQIQNIVEALMGTEDFSNWAVVLSTTDPSTFPITATLFIPEDSALMNITSSEILQFDPSTFAYHIIPQQLTFSVLKCFKIGSRLPTLLTHNTILVTNNSDSNYTIDDCRITHPDLYINGAIVVHGIGSLLNYSVFGGGFLENHHQSPPADQSSSSPGSLDNSDDHNKPIFGNQNDHNMGFHFHKSDAPPPCELSIPGKILVLFFIILFACVLYLDSWDTYLLYIIAFYLAFHR